MSNGLLTSRGFEREREREREKSPLENERKKFTFVGTKMRVLICHKYLSKATWKRGMGGGGRFSTKVSTSPDIKILVVLKPCASRYQLSGKGSLRNCKRFELACDFTGERKTQNDDLRGNNQWDLLALKRLLLFPSQFFFFVFGLLVTKFWKNLIQSDLMNLSMEVCESRC